ncbi:sulfur oxidation c-type cytochrome SoxX [Rhodopseudomonas sp. BR0M22]|uniref:sulfur oxidation c-type cytochrome SoxX n=1 Tax=Rhodopseudomonas sp. BR0M22 TaxID=2269369 RepID=UPI0013E04E73|nr:sulfur oxidation c-type cytochrome SoxX [Rhodopseudomonas sp. BR0M22]NEW91980.1 sulfur oxidation c-type cytochrome SoxX [Rhodopseudomonas sp. BR0M22]
MMKIHVSMLALALGAALSATAPTATLAADQPVPKSAGTMSKTADKAAEAAKPAAASTASAKVSPETVDAYIKATFGKAPEDWQKRIVPDETMQACNKYRNEVPHDVADAIMQREIKKVVYPADGKLLGDWKAGAQIANNGRGGQFSDKPETVHGGNCYACHQMAQSEVSFGTLGPSLTHYGKDRNYTEAEIKQAYTKIYNSQAVVPCSNMPRFGTNGFLSEQQIKDVLAFLFDPESPVNKE